MSRFNLNAQVVLLAPTTAQTNRVINQIRNQLRNVNVGVNVSVNRAANTQVRNTARNLNQVATAANKATSAAKNFGDAIYLAVRRYAAFVVGTTAIFRLIGAFNEGIREAIKFQREMVRVSQVTGKSLNSIRKVSEQISELSARWGVASGTLAEVSVTLAQTGLSARETSIALKALAKTSLAPTFGDIAKTTEGAIAIMGQFRTGAGQLEEQLGALNIVAKKFPVESNDLIAAVRRAGGAFQAAGGNLNELLALFTSVRATTRESAESIATGMRTIFTRIQRSRVQNYLEGLGVNLRDQEGMFVGPFEAIMRISRFMKTEGIRPGTQLFANIGEQLAGFRQISRIIPLLTRTDVALAALSETQKGANSLTEDATQAQKAMAVQIQKVKEEWAILMRTIGDSTAFKGTLTVLLALSKALIRVADAMEPIYPLLLFMGARGIGRIGGQAFRSIKARGFSFGTGGSVPGAGNKDTVPAMLTPGEFVINKNSAGKIGLGNLMSLNTYASGGLVTPNRHGYGPQFDTYRDLISQGYSPDVARWMSGIRKKRTSRGVRASAPGSYTAPIKPVSTGMMRAVRNRGDEQYGSMLMGSGTRQRGTPPTSYLSPGAKYGPMYRPYAGGPYGGGKGGGGFWNWYGGTTLGQQRSMNMGNAMQGALWGGMALSGVDNKYARGAGAGLMTTGMLGMMGAGKIKGGGTAAVGAGLIAGMITYEKAIEEEAKKIQQEKVSSALDQMSEKLKSSDLMSETVRAEFGGGVQGVERAYKDLRMIKMGQSNVGVREIVGALGEFGGGLVTKMTGGKVEGGAGPRGAVFRVVQKKAKRASEHLDMLIEEMEPAFEQFKNRAISSGMSFEKFMNIQLKTNTAMEQYVNVVSKTNRSFVKLLKAAFDAEARLNQSFRAGAGARRSVGISNAATAINDFISSQGTMTGAYETPQARGISEAMNNVGTRAFGVAANQLNVGGRQRNRLQDINELLYHARGALAGTTFGEGNLKEQFRSGLARSGNLSLEGGLMTGESGTAIVERFGQMFRSGDAAKLRNMISTTEGLNKIMDDLAKEFEGDIESAKEMAAAQDKLKEAFLQRELQIIQARGRAAGTAATAGQTAAEVAAQADMFAGGRGIVWGSNKRIKQQAETISAVGGLSGTSDLGLLEARLNQFRGEYQAGSPDAGLQLKIQETAKAIELLGNVSARTSTAMQRLQVLQKERAAGINRAEGFLNAGPLEQRRILAQESLAKSVGGGIASGEFTREKFMEMSGERQQAIIQSLRGVGERRLAGGKTGNMLADQLISPLSGEGATSVGKLISSIQAFVTKTGQEGATAQGILSADAAKELKQFQENTTQFIQNAAELTGKLGEGAIPSEITINHGKMEVEVILNGGEVLERIMPDISSYTETRIKEGINDMLKQKFPNLPPYMPDSTQGKIGKAIGD